MTLTSGTRIGPYEVVAPIGAGGMGEVLRARDPRLDREVAIKVLPAAFAADPDRIARFEREAKLLASLNHSNIAHVYGFESATLPDGSAAHFLAMELVPGEDLAERLKRGPIPVDEALAFARQIGEALGEAHEKGIVHRDLKPANVKVTPDGKVKVLDFGLARAFAGDTASGSSGDLSQSPTLAHTGTQAGLILGTAAYMSPEQARGRAVDKRADVWAFGVVLYEMLTARRPFGGETVSEILAAVIKDEPEWKALPAGLPPAVAGVLRRCLVKDPARRLHDIADARLLLEEEEADREPEAPRPATARAPRWREATAWLLAVAGVGAVAALAGKRPASRPVEPLTHFAVSLPGDQPMAFIDVPTLALSPDGRKLAFTVSGAAGQTMIHVRAFDQLETRPVPGTEGGICPFFSPDGGSIGFFADRRLKVISIAGGPAQNVADAPNARGGLWTPDGSILFVPAYDTGLWRVSTAGGVAQPVVSPEKGKGERTFRWPVLLPGGRAVLFTVGSIDSPNDYDKARLVAFSFATGERRVVAEGVNMAGFVAPDTLVYSRAGVLFAVRFDVSRLEVVGQATPALEGVAGDPSSGATYFAVANDGTLAAVRGAGSKVNRLLTLVDRKGVATQLPLTARGFRNPRFSPDGTRLAFTVGTAAISSDGDVWVYSLSSGSLNRLTFDGSAYPSWTPSGDRIAYMRGNQAVLARSADGTGAQEQLVAPGSDALVPGAWSADGRTLALTRVASAQDILFLTPGDKPRLFETDAGAPAFSRDGRFIAYASPALGLRYVFVRSARGEGKWQVSSEPGGDPKWSGDGRELFYLTAARPQRSLMAVAVEGGASFRASPPRVVADVSRYLTSTAPVVDWDAAPDGRRFVFIEAERAKDEGTRIDVTLHWARHLAAARPGGPAPAR